MAVDPSSKFAYVTNRSDNTVSIFKINSGSGTLTPIGTAATGAVPFHIVIDPSVKFAYVANEGSAISIFTIEADGLLTPAGIAATEIGGSVSLAVTGAK